MFVGIDWASTEHAVCVLDQTGKTVRAFRIPHSAAGFDDLVARLRRLGAPAGLPVALERPTAGWSTGCWKPAIRCPGPRRRHQGLARGRGRLGRHLRRRRRQGDRRAACGGATTSCGRSRRSRPPPGRCGPSCAPGASSSASAWPPSTSTPPPWTPSGPAPRPSSPTSNARSRWRSWSGIRRRSRPQASASSAWPPS
jgi:Transposase